MSYLARVSSLMYLQNRSQPPRKKPRAT